MTETPSDTIAPPLPMRELAWRSGWIVVRLLAAYCLAKQVSPFFYQQF